MPSHYRLWLEPDLEKLTFNGQVSINAEFSEPTTEVELNSADLDIKSASIAFDEGTATLREVTTDADFEKATLYFDEKIPVGEHEITIEYSGIISDQLRGLYKSVYTDSDGTDHLILASQCQSTDARRVFPCWDEPDFKATFETTMVVDGQHEAYSNGREISRTQLDDGRLEFRFAKTIPMSSYLLAFAAGPLEATEPVEVRGISTRVIVPRGNLHLTEYSLEAAAFCLDYLSEFYGIPYPGDKLDHIAIPDFAAGAMENVGLIVYRDAYLIIDEKTATHAELERSLDVIAHEIAHQWFGNLVTLRWWEGAWLNEAFATFMEAKTTDARRPDWNRWLSFQTGDKAWAHDTDHLSSTRKIEMPVQSPHEVDEMFDGITYGKGSAILRMIEQFMGEEQFRIGVGNYLKKHSYSNTDTADLWEGLDSASEWPVSEIMNTWVYQEGLPLVSVEEADIGIKLSQRRYLAIPDETDQTNWKIPVQVRGRLYGSPFESHYLLSEDEMTIPVDGDADWLVANAGGHGFYRVKYSDGLLARIVANLGSLDAIERHSLVSDTLALVLSGDLQSSFFLDLVSAFRDENEWAVWSVILGGLGLIEHHQLTDSAAEGFQAYVRNLVGPALERLGWEATDDESDLDSKLRGDLIAALGGLGNDEDAISHAREITRDLMANNDVDPEVATSALLVVAKYADRADFDKLWDAYKDAPTSVEEVRYLRAVGRANFPEAPHLIVERILSGEIRTQNSVLMLVLMMMTDQGEEAWKAYRSNWDELYEKVPVFSRRSMIAGISSLSQPVVAADVKGFFAETPFKEGVQYLAQRLEKLDANVRMRERETPVVAAYFGS